MVPKNLAVLFFSAVMHLKHADGMTNSADQPELHIRGGIVDNSKIIFLIFSTKKTYVMTPH